MTPLGMAAFIIEDFKPNAPDTNLDREAKRQCPLCNDLKKLKEMRGHVGHHIMLRSRGGKEDHLSKTASLPLLQLIFDTNPHERSVTTPVDSVVTIFAEPPSRSPVPNDRSNQTAHSIARSNTARPRSRRKTPHAPTSQSSVLTARKQFGNTTPSTTSC